MGRKEKRSIDEVAAIVDDNAEHDTLPKKKKKHKHKEQEKDSEENVDCGTATSDSPNQEHTKKKKKHDPEEDDSSEDEKKVKKDKKKKHKNPETCEESENVEETDNINKEDNPPKKEKKKKHKNREKSEESEKTEEAGDTNEEVNEDDDTEKTPKKKKKRDKKVETSEPQGPTKSVSGLEYLNKWKDDRANWKFQTMRQVWLLQHMYDDAMIADSDFDTMLEYVDSVKGKSRELTLQKAQTMLQQHELAEGENGEDEETTTEKDTPTGKLLNTVEYERVRQVIQLLL